MKIKIIAIAILFFAFANIFGCATTPKVVYLPTPVKRPAINLPPEPHYPVKDLKEGGNLSPSAVIKTYAISLKMCIGENKIIRKQVGGV